ncbi:cyclic nucleotide-regulated ABC bacteriocin/lantibiotic exporter [Calothrix sp. NIES-4071]|nr:cyclic nucleotide-regulated ABC bacteriocin/lantibiotic exporter [Calothrix sp. NIES-4071]BAZ56349.1 cyclic nucleotide-regulated ABC bacteriocin/lantibiotic exporter [Calothrix sp. NIES-4105]
MTYIKTSFKEFLASLEGFDQLPTDVIVRLAEQVQPLRYRIGQKIIGKDRTTNSVAIIYEGKARLLGYDSRTQMPITLKLLEKGSVIGAVNILRSENCETVIASSEVICLTLNLSEYSRLLTKYPAFASVVQNQCYIAEVFDILAAQPEVQANGNINLKELTEEVYKHARVFYPSSNIQLKQLDNNLNWFVSSGAPVNDDSTGARLKPLNAPDTIKAQVRLIGLLSEDLEFLYQQPQAISTYSESSIVPKSTEVSIDIPYASDEQVSPPVNSPSNQKYPFFGGRGELNSIYACFQMVSKHLEMPFRKDVVRRMLNEQIRRQGTISFQVCAYLAQLIGLKPQLIDIPATSITRVPTPALIRYGESYAVLYEANERHVVVGVPSQGVKRCKPSDLIAKLEVEESSYPPQVRVLLLSTTKETPQQRFGLSWFLPYLSQHKRVLTEVFVASFFIQLAALANPLVVQLIIDKVITQNSIGTLHILGALLLVVGLFESVLTTLRTYLFVDTTNRIDMGLGSQIIDHMLRLPLRYFEKRPVGELSTRINELENIRQFLTGTALTVGLDAIFSVVYIVVMLFYSWQLTLVGLGTIPIFILLTVVASPLISRQLRAKAERNAETQSYLVEVMSGIQTVKAQNIELHSRFTWQEKYARFVGAGFQTVITSTLAGSTSNFLNKLSALLVLWVGAYLVLQGELTLGELIAFRIISGYVTSPILRLAQLWQSFQEVALSLERLSDIVDTPQEAEQDRSNIPLPEIEGAVRYENVSFRFNPGTALQLNNVSIEFPPGKFVGIVGQSGAGKSTLTKLLIRLYEPEAGRILIDGYDVSKVELYSLRRQIGVVPQDTLLFDGTVQENIALTNPDASTEEIIEAAKIAVAHDFIMSLPNGYNTRVGERGAALSGGQRQRIAIARSVLQKPRLLVMDEATSALDYPTERQVCLNLAGAFKGTTVFFITHRLNTVRNADIIVVMDAGRVAEYGNHEELIAKKGNYYYLYNQQQVGAG